MTDPLPTEGPEREIFLRALRNYSEACEPPALTPGCPFAIDLVDGGRGCLEECVTLLARHNAPPPVDEIVIGKGLGLRPRPPRPRRGPAKRTRPFDCMELYLIDSASEDYSQWRLSSILEKLRRLLLWIEDGGDGRSRLIEEVLDEIARRDLNSEAIIRFGLGGPIAIGIYSSAVISAVDVIPESGTADIRRAREWAPLLMNGAPAGTNVAARLVAGYDVDGVASVIAWVLSADLEDIFEWRPPASKEILARFELKPTNEEYVWLMDRFTNTYLNDWHPASLRMEWRYLHGGLVPSCRPRDMAARAVDQNELASLLAHQACDPRTQRGGLASLGASQYVRMALRLLQTGRRDSAASLFQAVATLRPRNAEAYNNWAFCLLPDDPAKSLKLLDRAIELGMSRSLTLVGNRLLALYRLGKYAGALTYADEVFASWPTLIGGQLAHMWPFNDFGAPVPVDDLHSYVLELVTLIAAATESETVIDQWRRKVEALRS